MSDVWLNIRIGLYHIQAGRSEWWRLQLTKNEFHIGYPDGFFKFYQISWPRSYGGGKTYNQKI